MKFTPAEIRQAQKLKQLGLSWQPAPGQYVWDEAGIIGCESPFHDLVFYILDLKHFLRRAGTIANMQRDLCWLPVWYDARQILRDLAVSDHAVAERLVSEKALSSGSERLCLYRMIEEALHDAARRDPGGTPTAVTP
jgi:hypothetical protein